MPNYKISGLTAYPNSTFASTDRFEVSYYSGGIYYSRYLTGTQILATIPSGLTIGTTAITSGTVGRILFQGTGSVVQQDSTLFWDNTNKRLGVGATPNTSTRLDVRAQGALSSDIAFRVRNSADSVSLLEHYGNGDILYRNNANTSYLYWQNATGLEVKNGSGEFLFFNNNGVIGFSGTSGLRLRTTNTGIYINDSGNFYFGGATGISLGTGSNAIIQKSGTAPSSNIADHYYQYSADIVAGNAAPHFRTENGDIVKLFKGAVLTTSDGTLANAVIRIGELEARLQALGLLA